MISHVSCHYQELEMSMDNQLGLLSWASVHQSKHVRLAARTKDVDVRLANKTTMCFMNDIFTYMTG